MNTTKILGEAVGVQWQAVNDQTEANTAPNLTSAIIIGRFKRGAGLMDINQSNIRGMLGHEPNNPDYIAVQACLDTGVPSIKVLRVAESTGGGSGSGNISCEGALPFLAFTSSTNKQWDIKINDVLHQTGSQTLTDYLQEHPEFNLFVGNEGLLWGIANFGTDNQRIELISKVPNPVIEFYSDGESPLNPSAFIRNDNVFACLAIHSEPEPEPLPDIFVPLAVNNAGNVLAGSHPNYGSTLQLYAFSGNHLDVSNNLLKVSLPPNAPKFAGNDSVLVMSVVDSVNTELYTLKAVARNEVSGEYDLPVSFIPEHTQSSGHCAVNHNGEYIVAAGYSQPIQIYKRQTQTSYEKIGEFGEETYFHGLSFSPDGTKISFNVAGNADLTVYSFDHGMVTLLDSIPMLPNEALSGTTLLGQPVWMHNDILLRSYVWCETDMSTPYKGFLDTIKVDNEGLQLLARDDAIGQTYYRFSIPQVGKVLFSSSVDDSVYVLDVDTSGQIISILSLPDLLPYQGVLLPDGNRVVYGIGSVDQVGIHAIVN